MIEGEPELRDLVSEPIVRLLMNSDGVKVGALLALVTEVQDRLRLSPVTTVEEGMLLPVESAPEQECGDGLSQRGVGVGQADDD